MSGHLVFVTWKPGNARAFESAKRLGHNVTLIRSLAMEQAQNVDFSSSAYTGFVDRVIDLEDATDPSQLGPCVRRLHAQERIDGFLATVDALVLPVALLAEELNIPFTTSHGARTAKLKHECRAMLSLHGIEDTQHAIITTLAQAKAFAQQHGYPVVIKPACGSASEGAYVLADEASLVARFAALKDNKDVYRFGILIEEYLRGRFVSAEIGISHGRILPLAISERKTWARHEALELGTTIPAVIDPRDYDAVMDFAARVIEAADLRLGVFHIEIMLGEHGPRLIELNPRIMGSCLPNLFCLAGGGDIFELLVRIYMNEEIDFRAPSFDKFATVRWFGAADAVPRPETPDVGWAERYAPALHSLSLNLPRSTELAPCRGNLGNFGEVQVAHADYATSIGIAEEIVRKIEADIGFALTR
jgi:biotin carboxylase